MIFVIGGIWITLGRVIRITKTKACTKEGKVMRRFADEDMHPDLLDEARDEVMGRLEAINDELLSLVSLIKDLGEDMEDEEGYDLPEFVRMNKVLDEFLRNTHLHKSYEYMVNLLSS